MEKREFFITGGTIAEFKLDFDYMPDTPVLGWPQTKRGNFRYTGTVTLNVTSSGNFAGLTEDQVKDMLFKAVFNFKGFSV